MKSWSFWANNWMICVATALLFSNFVACLKPELPINPYPRGAVTSASITMGSDYRFQVYFDLGTNLMVEQNLKADWDLAFDCSPGGYHVFLNSSKAMFAATSNDDYYSVMDTVGLLFKWDDQTGDNKLTAIGEWADFSGQQPVYFNNTYIINRGLTNLGAPLGFKKIRIEKLEGGTYMFRQSNLDNTNESVFEIVKDSNFNFIFFSFNDGGKTVDVEPPKSEWDIVFTQFLEIFEVSGDTIPYLVTGVLLNPSRVEAAADSLTSFADINTQSIPLYTFTTHRNIIGYDWKKYSFSLNQYAADPAKNYLVKDYDGFYYKLHFTDFYDDQGNKGSPAFEFQKL